VFLQNVTEVSPAFFAENRAAQQLKGSGSGLFVDKLDPRPKSELAAGRSPHMGTHENLFAVQFPSQARVKLRARTGFMVDNSEARRVLQHQGLHLFSPVALDNFAVFSVLMGRGSVGRSVRPLVLESIGNQERREKMRIAKRRLVACDLGEQQNPIKRQDRTRPSTALPRNAQQPAFSLFVGKSARDKARHAQFVMNAKMERARV